MSIRFTLPRGNLGSNADLYVIEQADGSVWLDVDWETAERNVSRRVVLTREQRVALAQVLASLTQEN